jgi:trimeric autotransporter adhesin
MNCYNKSLNPLHSTFLAAIAAMNLIAITPAAAQELLDEHLWITDGSDFISEGRVRTMVKSDDTLYLAGDFKYVGPISGAGAAFTTHTGEPSRPFPLILGPLYSTVYDAVPDGEGGWIVGGDFSEVGGEPIANLVRLRADDTIEALPTPDARVQTLAMVGTTLYLGGQFTMVDGVPRNRAAAIDISAPGGALLEWNPNVIGDQLPGVHALLVAGQGGEGPVILAGRFTHVGGAAQANLAFVEPAPSGGAVLAGPGADDAINAIALLDQTLYIGGHFSQVGGVNRSRLAAVTLSTGAVLPWNPNPTGFGIFALAATPNAVYVSGNYSHITGVSRTTPAALHPTTGALLPWNPAMPESSLRAITPMPEGLYLGGWFSAVGNVKRHRLALVDAQTGALLDWPVHAGGIVQTIRPSPDGTELFIGGTLRSIGGEPRVHAAAIDLKTGRLTDWMPNPGGSVNDMQLTEDSIFLVGSFASVGNPSQLRPYAAEVDLVTGQPTAWMPPEFNWPYNYAVAVTDTHVYVGGAFSTMGGGLVELDRATGAWTGRNIGTASQSVRALLYDPDANLLYAGGYFTFLAGAPRNRLGVIDLVSGTATPWNPNLTGTGVLTMAARGDVLYVGGSFNSIGGQARSNAGAVLMSTGEVTPWNPSLTSGSGVHGTTLSLQAGHDVVYALGTFTRVGGVFHIYAAALDPDSGARLDWQPQVGGHIHASILDGSRLYLGGSFTQVLGQPREGVAVVTSLEPSGPLGDLNGDGVVDVSDLLILLAAWGPCPPSGDCPADLDGDGVVGVSDLLILLENWG